MDRRVRIKRISPHQIDSLNERIKRLERANEHQQAFLNITNEPQFVLGLDGHLMFVNHAWEAVFGFHIDELQDKHFPELIPPESQFPFRTALLNLNEGQAQQQIVCAIKGKTGKTFKVKLKMVLAREKDRAYCAIENITSSVEMNVRLAENQSRIEKLQNELERFAYIASHDLQEPLRMIGSFVQLIQKKYELNSDPSTSRYIHFTVDGVKRMQALLNDLLKFSRIGRKETSFETIDCNKVVNLLNKKYTSHLHLCKGHISKAHLPTVKGDKAMIIQLFQILIGNSLKFTGPENLLIRIAAHNREDCWMFTVTDNGIGIDQQFSERIFEVFQRLHTKEKYPGTGIGLALARKIVELHGGKIWVNTNYKKGLMLQFTIRKKSHFS